MDHERKSGKLTIKAPHGAVPGQPIPHRHIMDNARKIINISSQDEEEAPSFKEEVDAAYNSYWGKITGDVRGFILYFAQYGVTEFILEECFHIKHLPPRRIKEVADWLRSEGFVVEKRWPWHSTMVYITAQSDSSSSDSD